MTQIIPAIDVQNGHCVRLRQGRFDSTRVYGSDPLALARDYVAQGAAQLHLVDLDAARGAGADNRALIKSLAATLPVTLQVGGGVRGHDDMRALFAAGTDRVVIGSMAITHPQTVLGWLNEHGPERIVLALDVQMDEVPTVKINGWQTATQVTLWEALTTFAAAGLRHLLCTDIERDGMCGGPNIALYREIMQRFPAVQLQASGGVRNQLDLAALDAAGVPSAISGRALLEGTLRLGAQA